MAPKKAATKKKKREACSDEPPGMFDGMVVFLVENGVQPRRLQIWKEKLMLMGATIEDHFSRMVTHIFAVDLKSLLKKVGKEKMTCFNGGTDSGVDTYFGLCTYPGRETRHRIDLKVYPRSIYAFGLIAWTGNDVLNRRLRLLADSKGYRLDDTGLFLATQGSGRKRGERSFTSLSFKTEKEVFNFLGFPWLEPNERNL